MRCEMKKTGLSLDPANVNPGLLAVFTSHSTKKTHAHMHSLHFHEPRAFSQCRYIDKTFKSLHIGASLYCRWDGSFNSASRQPGLPSSVSTAEWNVRALFTIKWAWLGIQHQMYLHRQNNSVLQKWYTNNKRLKKNSKQMPEDSQVQPSVLLLPNIQILNTLCPCSHFNFEKQVGELLPAVSWEFFLFRLTVQQHCAALSAQLKQCL